MNDMASAEEMIKAIEELEDCNELMKAVAQKGVKKLLSKNAQQVLTIAALEKVRDELRAEIEELKRDYYFVSKLVVRHNKAEEVAKMLKAKDEQALKDE